MPATGISNKETKGIGKLKSFGLQYLWQVALLLPTGWDDLRFPQSDFSRLPQGGECLVTGQMKGKPSTRFSNGVPRLVGYLYDQNDNRIGFTAFGDSREFERKLSESGELVSLFGEITYLDGRPWLKSPGFVPANWVGHLRPRYGGKSGVINADTVRERVLLNLKAAIPMTAQFLENELRNFGTREILAALAGLPGWSLENILLAAHFPRNIETGLKAQEGLEHLAALGIIKSAQVPALASPIGPLTASTWRSRAEAIPFALTDEQMQSIEDGVVDLASGFPMRRVLNGDVGMGKSAVYLVLAAAVADAGGRVVVLLPNEPLARQVAGDFSKWWPDCSMQLVTGGEKGKIAGNVIIGTTAVLHRNIGKISLAIADEQQKFSVDQRERLLDKGTHLLEVTATCIPRSQALIRYGVLKVSKLTKCHVKKNIHTRIWNREEWPELYRAVGQTVKDGHQVLMVYPLRERDEKSEMEGNNRPGLRSAEEIFQWWDQKIPGKVRLIHGKMQDDEKEAALRDMKEGRAAILVSTTVVETGINLPGLRRVIVAHPERHGLTTLHQIRGRAARTGGEGWFDLFLSHPVKEATMKRLEVLAKTQDGFEIAEQDMKLRGIGDLSQASEKQSGADETFLFGRPVRIEVLDRVLVTVESARESGRVAFACG